MHDNKRNVYEEIFSSEPSSAGPHDDRRSAEMHTIKEGEEEAF
jgi:hypothetical protein